MKTKVKSEKLESLFFTFHFSFSLSLWLVSVDILVLSDNLQIMKVRLTVTMQKILPFLQTCPTFTSDKKTSGRQFLEACCGLPAPGHHVAIVCPEEYGFWNTVYNASLSVERANVFEKLFEFCSTDSALEHLLIDSNRR